MQEDKEGVFDAFDTVKMCLEIFCGMISTMSVNSEKMKKAAQEGFINATDAADYLVAKGMPFRSAYKISGQLVAECIQKGKVLETLSLEEYQAHSELFDEDVYEAVDIAACAAKRTSVGGTSPESVQMQIDWVRNNLKE